MPLTILGIPGSLRKASMNKALLRAAIELAPSDITIEVADLSGIPPYNQDEETNPPSAVVDLKARVRAADAVLFSTPEYNYSIPGVLKNAIDWVSRPYGDSAWDGKPVAVMGASPGMLGTARCQYHLRQSFLFLNVIAVTRPEVMLGSAVERFDADLKLVDPKSREMVARLVEALATLARKVAAA
ncbi:MAG TPA: NAD(P)H-dependent oxidoreductase [Candidatus Acidoferrum sp.]|nr:NAD(P)H-dependent oxidoreductase [Candidatus Acidoferrum sp.]